MAKLYINLVDGMKDTFRLRADENGIIRIYNLATNHRRAKFMAPNKDASELDDAILRAEEIEIKIIREFEWNYKNIKLKSEADAP